MYDLIILGTGPAGLSASIYATRFGLKTLTIGKVIGGTANYAAEIDNYPTFIGTGVQLMKKMKEHADKFNSEFVLDEVVEVDKEKEGFIVKTKKKEYKSKGIIIAIGTERKKLNIPGEQEFLGKGVSYCATCDGFFFKNKIVGVVGGRDGCANSALMLSELAKKVYLIYRGSELKCTPIYKKRLGEKKNIEVILNSIPVEIKGKDKVEGFVIEEKGKIREIKLDGIFIEIGSYPSTEIFKNLGIKTNEEGYIITNNKQETNIEGVYAAGDITNSVLRQILVACSQGAIASSSASEWLEKSGKK